jgi:hypothetical protein
LIVSIVSVLPAVQNYHSTSGLLQSSFVTLYVVFLTWSAMTSEKSGIDLKKKKIYLNIIYLDPTCNPSWYGANLDRNSTVINASESSSVGISSIIALIIFFGLIIYSA